MKTYEEFAGEMLAKIPEYLPKEMQECDFKIQKIRKTNGVEIDGIVMTPPEGASNFVSPIIYPEDFYNLYTEENKSENVLLNQAARIFSDSRGMAKVLTADYIRDVSRWIPVIVNTERNKELLADCPHHRFGKTDCSVMYKAIFKGEAFGDGSASVSNGLAEAVGFTEREIFELTKENVKELAPTVVKNFEEFVNPDGMSNIDIDSDEPIAPDVVIVTNPDGYFGAGAIIDTTILEQLSERMGGNLIIIPSSIHEVLITKENVSNGMSVKEFENMVQEINHSVVNENDFLSDHVFFYDRKEKTITMPCAEKKREERDAR